MASASNIEWTDATWTPIRARNLKTGKVGWHCEHATTGCEFCYAEGMNKRLGTGLLFKPGHRKDIEIFLDEEMLLAPLRWKKPRMIFVCSMTDAFADFVKDEWLDKMFAVMALSPQHTFQVLTKRAERMRKYLTSSAQTFPDADRNDDICAAAFALNDELSEGKSEYVFLDSQCYVQPDRWPLSNVWLGTSCERQQEADERIPLLLQTPAAIRFVSLEPLLGPIDLERIKLSDGHGEGAVTMKALTGWHGGARRDGRTSLDWVIVGGESGPNARRMEERWARDIRDECAAAGVPFFFKQWGQHDPETFDRVGKKVAGRTLDGRTHDAMPEVHP